MEKYQWKPKLFLDPNVMLDLLGERERQHQETALKVAHFLEAHPKIKVVRYPGLPSHPQYALGQKQMRGYTGLMSFQLATEDLDRIKTFFNSLQLFKIGGELGRPRKPDLRACHQLSKRTQPGAVWRDGYIARRHAHFRRAGKCRRPDP